MDCFLYFLFSGNLFHIDFGYILGRDPKPLPPPMKLSKEMVKKKIIIISSLSMIIMSAIFFPQIMHVKKVALL